MSSISHTVAKPVISKPVSEKAQRKQREKQDIVAVIGRIASILSVLMYVSYLTQIVNNLGGKPGQPLAAALRALQLHHVDHLRLHEAQARHPHHRRQHPRHHPRARHLRHRHRALGLFRGGVPVVFASARIECDARMRLRLSFPVRKRGDCVKRYILHPTLVAMPGQTESPRLHTFVFLAKRTQAL